MTVELTSENFASFENGIIDFWATWCGPCRMIAPVLEEIADEKGITVGKVNVDEQPQIAREFGIESIPTLIFVKNKEAVGKAVGYRPKDELEAIITKAFA